MLDGRVYRTAFLPALFALFLAAFALQDRPTPGRSELPPDAFSSDRAFGTVRDKDPGSLQGLYADFPDRTPGSPGDQALADYVAEDLAAPWAEGQRATFTVRKTTDDDGYTTVVATRPGASSRRIVVLADRDSRGRAELSATAVLLELARVFKSRDLDKTLVIVSTTGASNGFKGARDWARSEAGGPVDGVLVLGDLASNNLRKPWVVSWTGTPSAVPLGLERTVQAAVRRETRADPGGPHAVGQWVRRALPVTLSEQGPIASEGLPAVLLSASGELGPDEGATVYRKRLRAFGRSAVRAVGALDAVGRQDAPAFEGTASGISTLRNVAPDWTVRLVVGTLLLPALLAALDAFFRARRRHVPIGSWLAWLAVAAVPLPAAWLWLRVLAATGLVDAPAGVVNPARWPVGTSGIIALVSAAIVAALVWFGARLVARAFARTPAAEQPVNGRRGPGAPGVEGLAVATALWLCVLVGLAWVRNPYAAGLLVPAAHLWLFAATGWRGRAAAAALVVGLVVPVLAIVHLAGALNLGPHELVWGMALAAMTGAGIGSMLLLAGLLAAFAGVFRVLIARRRMGDTGKKGPQFATRGPLSYAGPGSLGGTESALRR
ncbi:hypothetical protein OJ997_12215 [Solirubrobacter phytolaccae]|uniref:M28 family peptidase n=1 Tax=Solirubrobacter phytolaccae TaxID=1404360 RepID=A0A9X3N7B0_9ACTN|nr:hypothetical protein [Solirubrobacter phytolaccae]MDA0181063.1 hypothetical protein [Solirubrobacter phytolaccae]